MKDENIKEILDNLKNIEDYLSFSEASKLLDYITNLQDRIDESIELINQNICGGSISNANELLNILQEKSDE